MSLTDLIDFDSEPCEWEPETCERPAAGLLWHDEGPSLYCQEHLSIWQAELDRQRERDMPKLPGLQGWYVQAARKAGVMR